jgi:hypothetical protein
MRLAGDLIGLVMFVLACAIWIGEGVELLRGLVG